MPYLKSARKTEKQQPEDTFLVEFLSEMSHKRGVYQYYTLCTLHLTRWRKKEWYDVQHVRTLSWPWPSGTYALMQGRRRLVGRWVIADSGFGRSEGADCAFHITNGPKSKTLKAESRN